MNYFRFGQFFEYLYTLVVEVFWIVLLSNSQNEIHPFFE